jgi:hypothetical protein
MTIRILDDVRFSVRSVIHQTDARGQTNAER